MKAIRDDQEKLLISAWYSIVSQFLKKKVKKKITSF